MMSHTSVLFRGRAKRVYVRTAGAIDSELLNFGKTSAAVTNWRQSRPATGKLRLGNLQAPEVGLQMVLRRGSNFYFFYDHIIAGSHFMALASGFRTRPCSFLWSRSLSLAFRSRLPGPDLPSCRRLRSGFAASPRCRRGCLAKPCGLRRMSASLDFRFLRGLASTRRHSLNYSCRRGIVKRGARREDKTWSAESYVAASR